MPQKKEITLFEMNHPPIIGETFSKQKIYLGGFSGLNFIEAKNEGLIFQTLSDRGPNGELVDGERTFLVPEYTPLIITLMANKQNKELSVLKMEPLKNQKGELMSGLPHHRKEENPIDVFGMPYSINSQGIDSEAMVDDGEGGLWVAEEYGPSLLRFDKSFSLIKRLSPVSELPKMYAHKKTNRGFEAIARFGKKLWAILQSPLPLSVTDDQNRARIIEIDTETNKITAEYFYPFYKENDKIGDAVAISENELLVLEQNGKLNEESSKLIYRITLGTSDESVMKKLIVDLKDTPFNQYEKIEGLTIVSPDTLAVVLDNDFQLSGITDKKSGLTPTKELKNQLLLIKLNEKL